MSNQNLEQWSQFGWIRIDVSDKIKLLDIKLVQT